MTMRVLIVDDDVPIRRLLQDWLEEEGATVLQARTAEEGLALIRVEGAPVLALCDIRLPGKDGLWLADQLRVTHPETAVVMTTGVHEFDAAVNSLHAGVVDYLVKPFTRERVTDALKRALFAHKSRQALAAMRAELAQLRAQIGEVMAELELNSTSSLEAMLAMLRARQAESHDHAHRVARLAVNLAMTLQIGEPRLSDIERAALLHNVGRIALPDELRARPESAMSPADLARVRSYPLHGQAMLKNVPFLAGAADITVSTHERYDGTGFPHGLRGEEIPLGARIIAVADAYDALTAGAGRDHVTPPRAVEILTTDRAGEFDPLVLGALRTLQPE